MVEENSFSKRSKNKKKYEKKKIKKYEKKRKAKEIEELSKVDDDVQNSSADEFEEDSEEKVVFNNIEPTQRKLAKFRIPEKDVLVDERLVNSVDDFQTTPSKKRKVKQTARVIFPPEQSKLKCHIEKEVLSKLQSPVEEEAFISKKVFDVFHDVQIDVCFYYLRKKSKYEPNNSYKYSTLDCNFMNIIWFVMNVYSVDDSNLNAEGQKAHLNECINEFHMHTVVPWHTVVDIYISMNIKEKSHWVLSILSFSERCIFLYDSSGHYTAVLAEIKKLAEIIPLFLQTCNFYEKKGIDFQKHQRYKDKDFLDLFDMIFEDNLPQQPSGSLDYGLYMITYVECLSYDPRVSSIEFNPNTLCTRYIALLWDYGMRKQEANAHTDFEAPLRPVRQSRITSVTKVFGV
ncbi:hypothetical protein BC332_11293 [Capsicum chinense]|nr:hypothetical protein BC332_11293 [Capsicum chinense]